MKSSLLIIILVFFLFSFLNCGDVSRWDIIEGQINDLNDGDPKASEPPPYDPPPAETPEPDQPPVIDKTAVAEGKVKVLYRCVNPEPTPLQLIIHLQIENRDTQPVNLDELSLNYYYTKEGYSAQTLNIDFISATNVTPEGKFFNDRLNLTFPGADKSLEEMEALEIQLRINKDDWSCYNQTDDYSWNPDISEYTENPEVTLYKGGTLSNGIEPWAYTDPAATPTPLPYTAPEIQPDLKVLYQCFNNDPVDLQIEASMQIRNERSADINWGQVVIRYYFTMSAPPIHTQTLIVVPHPLNPLDIKIGQIQLQQTDKYCLEFTFATQEVIPAGQTTAPIRFSINFTPAVYFDNWNLLNEADDWSFDATILSQPKENHNISLHYQDTHIFGLIPN